MKVFFFSTLAVLIALSLVAQATKPRPVDPSKTQLIWSSDDNPFRREQLEPFNALHPELHLQLDPGNSEIEKVIVQSLAGVGPDLFDCYQGYQLTAYVKAGVAWDVTDELKKLGVDITQTWPTVQPCASYEGRVYGFPVNAAANGLWFHTDLLAEAGIDLPKTAWQWEQAIPLLQKLMQKDSRGTTTRYGIVFDWDNNYLQFIYQWGGRVFSADGTRCVLDAPEAIAAVQFMQDLVFKYKVAPDLAAEMTMAAAGGWGGASVITLFGAKRSACALGGRWWLCALRDKQYDLHLGAAEAPYGKRHVFVGYGKATLINKNSPNRYEALKFLHYLTTPQYNKLINHQADGLGPVMKYAFEEDYLHDPDYPEETDNAVWRNLLAAAEPEQVSPFMNGAVMQRVIGGQLDLVKAGSITASQAMREAARRVNLRIEENLRQSPDLRAEYDRRVAARKK
jgi:multiple sugar transport system substrate-binding protein